MKENLNKIKDKIRALKNLANDKAATEGEVAAAMNLAHRLCREYMLNIEDIATAREEFIVESKTVPLREYRMSIGIEMDVVICSLFNCLATYNTHFRRLTVWGIELEIDTAIYMIDLAHNTLDNAWEVYKRSLEYKELKALGIKSKTIKRDFFKGFYVAVHNKAVLLKREAQEETPIVKSDEGNGSGTSLIVLKNQLITEKLNEANPNLRTVNTRKNVSYSTQAFSSGKDKGNNIEFSKGVTQQCLRLQG